MKISNNANHTIISKNAIYASTLGQKIFGMIFIKTPVVMIFKTRFGVHTFFMQFPIDVIVLDKKKQVVRIRKKLKPNRIFVWNPIYSLIVELPVGSVEKSKIQIGDFWELI